MTGTLKQYFPMLHERESLLRQIQSTPALRQQFDRWQPHRQKEFLDFCTGVRGVKLLYDSFFKEILSPEYTPERLNRLLSVLLGEHVRIKYVLPGDSTRIADESSLLIMDIIVELDDGSLVNVEAQKQGYAFPGQRSACYSADLLLRQYKRLRDERKKKFTYTEVKEVYTIVFIEESAGEFKKFPQSYLHYFEQRSDTGLKLDLLQKYLFVPLDIFGRNIQNRDDARVKSPNPRHVYMPVDEGLYDPPRYEEEVGQGPHEFRISGRIVGVRSTEQSVWRHLTLTS